MGDPSTFRLLVSRCDETERHSLWMDRCRSRLKCLNQSCWVLLDYVRWLSQSTWKETTGAS